MKIYQDTTDGFWKVINFDGKVVNQAETQERAMELADLYEALDTSTDDPQVNELQ